MSNNFPFKVYLFDLNSARRPVLVESFIIQRNHIFSEEPKVPKGPSTNGTVIGANGINNTNEQLPERVRVIKETVILLFFIYILVIVILTARANGTIVITVPYWS